MVIGGTIYSAMDGPGGPILGETNYGVTVQVFPHSREIAAHINGSACTAAD